MGWQDGHLDSRRDARVIIGRGSWKTMEQIGELHLIPRLRQLTARCLGKREWRPVRSHLQVPLLYLKCANAQAKCVGRTFLKCKQTSHDVTTAKCHETLPNAQLLSGFSTLSAVEHDSAIHDSCPSGLHLGDRILEHRLELVSRLDLQRVDLSGSSSRRDAGVIRRWGERDVYVLVGDLGRLASGVHQVVRLARCVPAWSGSAIGR